MTLIVLLAIAFVGFAGFVLLLVGLIEAPWQILLAILVGGLVMIQLLSSQSWKLMRKMEHSRESPKSADPTSELSQLSQPPSKLPEQIDEQTCVYRGVAYKKEQQNSESESESHSTSVEGTYRGHPWHQVDETPRQAPPTPTDLTYRGIKITKKESS
ncbi:MAG: DUF4278 domain-containing protein [Elainellaceae cyanobacterium]